MVTIRYFAAAAEAAGTASESVQASTAGELRAEIAVRHGAALERVLARCAVLSDGVRLDSDDDPLRPDAVVDVLPPFAGG
ncbi:ThiS family protein [mine drainage metagenome]|uniref:ThiS family protein n=1 Tax=mine drainage metagenome TaxID=410659 RepID=A0A1J5QMH0_9ZZZZ